MMEKMVVTVSNQNINQNFRRNNIAPNRQRDSDQQVIPPFQEIFLDEDEGIVEESEENAINMFETDNSIHNCSTEEDQPSPSCWDEEILESEDYRLGFENSIKQVREQYELRSKKSLDNSKPKASEITIKKRLEKTSKAAAKSKKSAVESSGKNKEKDDQNTDKQSQPTSSTSIAVSAPDKIDPKPVHSENQPIDSATKAMANKTELRIPKSQSTFNLESEIAKIKISIPLSELATQDVYKGKILKALNLGENSDTVNLSDDQPALLFGPNI